MDINVLLNAASFLNDTDVLNQIQMLDKLEREKFYAITIWGHFSSGKSYLINNILNKNILPVQKRESTAVLTYIMYGENEKCRIVKCDGQISECGLDVIKEIYQENYSEKELLNIDHLEIEIRSDLLKNGMVFVDTPGINTVIKRHQDLALRAVEQSGEILYVLGSAPTNVDRQFVQNIIDTGIKVTFVRTNCDRINSNEEIPEETLRKEEATVRAFTNNEPSMFFVSNIESSTWYQNIELVKDYLKKVSDNLQKESERALYSRKKVLANYIEEKLNIELNYLESSGKGAVQEIEEEINQCKYQISELNAISLDREKIIKNKIDETKREVSRNAYIYIDTKIDDFQSKICSLDLTEEVEKKVSDLYESHMNKAIIGLEDMYDIAFGQIVGDHDFNTVIEEDDEIPTYSEICSINSDVLNQYQVWLKEAVGQLEIAVKNRQIAEDTLQKQESSISEKDYETEMQELENQLNNIPSDMALKLSEDQPVQPSKVLRHIGEAADLALLLVPGDAIVAGIKGAVDTTKLAQMLAKGGKLGKIVLDSANTVGKSANTIDKVRDFAYAVNTIFGKRGYSTQEQKEKAKKLVDKTAEKAGSGWEDFKEKKRVGTVLDALSVAYWTEKLGEKFDKPPKYVIDEEEQAARNQLRQEITRRQNLISEKRIQEKRELGLLNTEAKEKALEEKEKERVVKEIQVEYEKKEKEAIERAKFEAIETFKNRYIEYYRNHLTTIAKKISDKYSENTEANINIYIELKNSELISNLEVRKKHLENLINDAEQSKDSIQNRMVICKQYISAMEGMI